MNCSALRTPRLTDTLNDGLNEIAFFQVLDLDTLPAVNDGDSYGAQHGFLLAWSLRQVLVSLRLLKRFWTTCDSYLSQCALIFKSKLVGFEAENDQVHLLVNDPPKVALSKLVNSLKGVSSQMIGQKNYPSIAKKLRVGALWSPSYFDSSCVGAPIAVIR